MRFSLALLICAISVSGQEPAQPTDPLSSLKAILARQKDFDWLQIPASAANPGPPTPVSGSISAVNVDVTTCILSLKDGRVFPNDRYETLQTLHLKIPDIERVLVETLEGYVDRQRAAHGQKGWDAKTKPSVFVLELEALSNRSFSVHRWSKNKDNEVIERDLQLPSVFIVFPDEASAQEAAAAMRNAKAYCTAREKR